MARNFKILMTFIVMLLTGQHIMAYDFRVEWGPSEYLYYNYVSKTDETVELARCTCSGDVIISDHVTYTNKVYDLVSIGDDAFSNNTNITSVKFVASETYCSITSIGNNVFKGCTSLKSVKLPSSVKSIGEYAFYGCTSLTSLNLPNNATSIGQYAFYNCKALSSIELPTKLTSINQYTFYGCTNLTTINVPSNVYSIGNNAFYGCLSLESITINNSYTSFGKYFFKGCSKLVAIYGPRATDDNRCWINKDGVLNAFAPAGLTSYDLPESVNTIGFYAFGDCKDLTSITIPETVTKIEQEAFTKCQGLESLSLPNNLTTIGDEAFYACNSLASVAMGNAVTTIGASAFLGCSSLESITIPETVTSVGQSAFRNCSSLNTVNFNAANCTKMGSSTYPVFDNCTNPATLNIGNNVQSIPDYAFSNWSGLTTVNIGYSVRKIGEYAFKNCSELAALDFNAVDCTTFGSKVFDGCTHEATLTIGEYVQTLPDYAFGGLNLIKVNYDATNCTKMGPKENFGGSEIALNIGDNVQTIPDYAFCYCSWGKVNIGNSVTSIGESTFENTHISELNIGPSVTSISANAFNYATIQTMNFNAPNYTTKDKPSLFGSTAKITTVNIGENVQRIPDSAFKECGGLTTVNMGNSVTFIGYKAFYDCTSLTSVTIPEKVTSIGQYAFYRCTGLTTVTYNATNCNIMGDYYSHAFSGCTNLTTLNIGENVQIIPDYAFCGCSGLNSVNIGNSVISIGDNAFRGCGMTSVTIPEKVTSIGQYAFYRCTGLTTVTYNATNCYKGDYAFSGCTNLTTLNIGENVQIIPDYAFSGCSELNSVNIGNSVISIGVCAFSSCSGLTSVTIGNSVTTIGGGAFAGCSGLTSVTIPNSVTSIGGGAFAGCNGLKAFYSIFASDDNRCLIIDGNLVAFAPSNITIYSIPETVTSIGNNAFSYCEVLTSVTIPNTVTSIGDLAFYNCNGLTSVTIGKSVTSIGKKAFYECIGVTSVTIGESVTSIGDEAFYYCTNLATVINYSKLYISVGSKSYGYVAYYATEVIKGVKAESVTLNMTSLKLEVGDTELLKATVLPEDTTDKTVTWSSSNDEVVTVNENGEIEAVALGKATITATCGSVSATCEVDVMIFAESVTLSKTSVTLKAGESETLTATVKPDNTTYKTVTWTSTKEDVATVDENGKITAVSKGAATIIATCGTVSATCAVTVEYSDATDIIVTPGSGLDDIFTKGLTIKDGESKKIDLTVVPATASPEFVWTSSNEDVVTIDKEGNITAVGVGTATVTVTSGEFSKTFTVTVDPVPAESVTLSKTSVTLKVGESEILVATVLPENTTDKTVTWTSSDISVVTVDENGKLTAVGGGNATVTATCGSVSATCKVTVIVPAESVLLSASDVEMLVGDTEMLVATVLPENTTDKTVTWESSDASVVTIDNGGYLTAVGAGNAVVTAVCGNAYAACKVAVSKRTQEIVWEQSFDDVRTGESIFLEAFTTSGLEVRYEIVEGGELVSLVDNILTVDAEGIVRIVALQDGNDEYEAAEHVEKVIDIISGIENIKADGNGRYIVWNMQGTKVLDTENAKDIRYLPEGFYIINGTKVLVK